MTNIQVYTSNSDADMKLKSSDHRSEQDVLIIIGAKEGNKAESNMLDYLS